MPTMDASIRPDVGRKTAGTYPPHAGDGVRAGVPATEGGRNLVGVSEIQMNPRNQGPFTGFSANTYSSLSHCVSI